MAFWTRVVAQAWLAAVGLGLAALTLVAQTPDGPSLVVNALVVLLAAVLGSAVVWTVGVSWELPIGIWKFGYPPQTGARVAELEFRERRSTGAVLFFLLFPLAGLVMGALGLFVQPRESLPFLVIGELGVPALAALLAHNHSVVIRADEQGFWIRSALGWNDVSWSEVAVLTRVETTNRPRDDWARSRQVGNPLYSTTQSLVARNREQRDLARLSTRSDPADALGRFLDYARARGVESSSEKTRTSLDDVL